MKDLLKRPDPQARFWSSSWKGEPPQNALCWTTLVRDAGIDTNIVLGTQHHASNTDDVVYGATAILSDWRFILSRMTSVPPKHNTSYRWVILGYNSGEVYFCGEVIAPDLSEKRTLIMRDYGLGCTFNLPEMTDQHIHLLNFVISVAWPVLNYHEASRVYKARAELEIDPPLLAHKCEQ